MHARSDQRRQRAYRLSIQDSSVQPSSTVEADARLDAQALGPALGAALDALSPDQREVLLLNAWAGLSPTEIAQALSISNATVRTRLHRARAKAAQHVERHDSAAIDTVFSDKDSAMTQLDDLLLQHSQRFPVDDPPEREALDHARHTLRLAATSEHARSDARRRGSYHGTRRASWRRRAMRPAAALAMVCLAGVLTIIVGTGSTSPPSAAAAVLQRLAKVAAAQSPVAAPHAGHYLHVASLQAGETGQGGISGHPGCTVLVPERRQIWINASGSGRIVDVPGRLSFFSERGRLACEQWHSALLHDAATVRDTWYAPGCYSLGEASRLNGVLQGPKMLLGQMRQIDGGPTGPAGDFSRVGSFLRESDASPALRAAIYRAAATISGVRLLGTVTDRLGRHGIGMCLTSGGFTSELVFNPRDGSMLAQQTVNRTGQLIGWGVYRPTVIVTRVHGHPPVRLAPACRPGGPAYGRPGAGGTTIFTGPPQPRH